MLARSLMTRLITQQGHSSAADVALALETAVDTDASHVVIEPGRNRMERTTLVTLEDPTRGLLLVGDRVTLVANAPMASVPRITRGIPLAHVVVAGYLLDAVGLPGVGLSYHRPLNRTRVLTRSRAIRARTPGFQVNTCQASTMTHGVADSDEHNGFFLQGCSGLGLASCEAVSNSQDGLRGGTAVVMSLVAESKILRDGSQG